MMATSPVDGVHAVDVNRHERTVTLDDGTVWPYSDVQTVDGYEWVVAKLADHLFAPVCLTSIERNKACVS